MAAGEFAGNVWVYGTVSGEADFCSVAENAWDGIGEFAGVQAGKTRPSGASAVEKG